MSSYIDNSRPVKVQGQISGAGQLDSAQPSPANATALATYANGVQASLAFGPEIAPRVLPETSNNRHKRVCVFGETGFVHWRFESWERSLPGTGYEGGDLNYGEQDVIAQGGLTDAVFEWLDDESKVHPTHLKQSLAEFNLLLGIYYSGLTNTIVELPFDPPDGMIDMFRERL